MDFDEFAQDYQKIHSKNIRLSGETPDYFHRYKLNLVKNFYCRNKLKEPKKILDFGCGIGKIEQHILSYFPNSKVIGIDSSTESIDRAKSFFKKENFSFYISDGSPLPFANSSFDAVVLFCVLHHIAAEDRHDIMQEIRRVLSQRGYLFLVEHNPINPLTKHIVKNCPFDKDAQLIREKDCSRFLEKLGFSMIKSDYIVFFPSFLKVFRPLEKYLKFLPFGAQYFIVAKKD